MTRPDLKSDFNGWQASDPTPQEKSDGNKHTPPAPSARSFRFKNVSLLCDSNTDPHQACTAVVLSLWEPSKRGSCSSNTMPRLSSPRWTLTLTPWCKRRTAAHPRSTPQHLWARRSAQREWEATLGRTSLTSTSTPKVAGDAAVKKKNKHTKKNFGRSNLMLSASRLWGRARGLQESQPSQQAAPAAAKPWAAHCNQGGNRHEKGMRF